MGRCRAQFRLGDPGEAIDARMNKEAFESRHAGRSQISDVLLVVANDAAPRHPIHVALAFCRFALGLERRNRGGRWQTIEWHVHQQREASGRGRARRRLKTFPFRSPGLIDVDVRVHKSRKHCCIAKILHGDLRGDLVWRNDIKDPSILHEHARRMDSSRGDYPSRKKGLEIHRRNLDVILEWDCTQE